MRSGWMSFLILRLTWSWDVAWGAAFVCTVVVGTAMRTTRTVKAGEELYLAYGAGYWATYGEA